MRKAMTEMKKIIAVILALVCVFAMFSCKDNDSIEAKIEGIAKMYESSAPTKIVTQIKNTVGERVYEAELTFTTGSVGANKATVYEWWEDDFRSVSEGSGSTIVGAVKRVTGREEYLEGTGYRVSNNGITGKWDAEGTDFAPSRGAIKIDLTVENLIDPKYENDTLTFSVAPANASKVLGTVLDDQLGDDAISGNVSVSVTSQGMEITGVTISYVVAGEGDYPDVTVTITSAYTYDLEEITITK